MHDSSAVAIVPPMFAAICEKEAVDVSHHRDNDLGRSGGNAEYQTF